MGAWFDRLTMSLSNGADASDFTLTPTLSLKGEGESKMPFDFRSFSLLWGGSKILRFDGL